jgi:hypothetical protein
MTAQAERLSARVEELERQARTAEAAPAISGAGSSKTFSSSRATSCERPGAGTTGLEGRLKRGHRPLIVRLSRTIK